MEKLPVIALKRLQLTNPAASRPTNTFNPIRFVVPPPSSFVFSLAALAADSKRGAVQQSRFVREQK